MDNSFGTIRNNTALKQGIATILQAVGFWNHSKQHSSKTRNGPDSYDCSFWNHSKQHSSKTKLK